MRAAVQLIQLIQNIQLAASLLVGTPHAWPRSAARTSIHMKGKHGYRKFSLAMWYGDVLDDDQAVAAENYDEAGGLAARVERLRSQHPILPREQRVEEAVADGDWEMAAIFQRDLDAVKANLGLPRFGVGQAVEHAHRTEPPLRGIVLDVDLSCAQSDQWVHAAGVVERAAEQGCPPEECDTDLTDIGRNWSQQCFYTVLTDLDDYVEAPAPPELAAWFVDPRTAKPPAPLYIAESSLKIRHEDAGINHPEANKLFTQHTLSPMRGRVHQPSPALRLWQQQRAQLYLWVFYGSK